MHCYRGPSQPEQWAIKVSHLDLYRAAGSAARRSAGEIGIGYGYLSVRNALPGVIRIPRNRRVNACLGVVADNGRVEGIPWAITAGACCPMHDCEAHTFLG